MRVRNVLVFKILNISSFYGSSCANNDKDALNTPETLPEKVSLVLVARQHYPPLSLNSHYYTTICLYLISVPLVRSLVHHERYGI